MEMMRWRIARQKLLFLRKIMLKDNSNICKRAIINEAILEAEGLGHECRGLATTVGLQDLRDSFKTTSKGDIRRAVSTHSSELTKEEVQASRKVGDRATEDPEDRRYLNYMILPDSRIWMRVRARSIKGVKVNNKRSFTNLTCRFCDDETEESQEHLEECRGCEHERRSLNMTKCKDKVTFWRRMTTKITDWGRGERLTAAVAGGHISMEARVVTPILVPDQLVVLPL